MTAAKQSRRRKTAGRAASLEREIKRLRLQLQRVERKVREEKAAALKAKAAKKKSAPKKKPVARKKPAAPKKPAAAPKKKPAAPKKKPAAAKKKPAAPKKKPAAPKKKPAAPKKKPATAPKKKPAPAPKKKPAAAKKKPAAAPKKKPAAAPKKKPVAPAAPPQRPEKTPGARERKLRLTREMTVEALKEAFAESREQGKIDTYAPHPPTAWMMRRQMVSLYLTVPVGELVTQEVVNDVFMQLQVAADEIRETMLGLIRLDGRLPDQSKLRFATTLEAFSFGDGNSNGKSARTVIDTTKAGKRINEIATVFYMGHRSVPYSHYANEARRLLERLIEPPTILLVAWVYGWEKTDKRRRRRGP